LLEVGQVVKPHGLRGEVVVALISDRTERLEPGAVLATAGADLHVRASRPHQGRWIVSFVGVEDRNGAEALRGTALLAPAIDDPEVLWIHQLIGAEVVDTEHRRVGIVESVQANPASDLLVLDGGALVPLTFVVEHSEGRLVIDPPPGLLDPGLLDPGAH
jgi:16S rRNA processing protein RimM